MFHQRFHQASTSVPAIPALIRPGLPVVSVFGLGRAGLTAVAALAGLGCRVIGVDGDPDRIAALETGPCGLHGDGLQAMLDHGRVMGRIAASDDILTAVGQSDITLIAPGAGPEDADRCDPYPLMVMGRTLGAAIRLKGAAHGVILHAPDAARLCAAVLAPALAQGCGREGDHRLSAMPVPSRDDDPMQRFRHVLSDFLSPAR